ncbi:MAG TPA: mandelate racemase/muconate lactonizing enzyme family protein, partial [Bordetella sp.]
MSTIQSVSVCIARVPLDSPVTFATRQVTAREYCLVRVRDTEGREGLGYCYAVNSAGRLLSVAVTDLLAPKLVGQDSLRVEGLWTEMYQEALLMGRAGGVMRSLSALDIALWDLNARAAGLPLYRYLGASAHD